ncbi:1-deoxy-D-xylulose-5-phosphate synthase, partial [Streptomyces rubellomurinus subsp. indigoferus]
ETDAASTFHPGNPIDPSTCPPISPSAGVSSTSVFGEELLAPGAERPDLVAITAAMLQPAGLAPVAKALPTGTVDVGRAGQHAVSSAAGLATGGLHPVVAGDATFRHRAFDQVRMDVALH